jgi:hypothetical protein
MNPIRNVRRVAGVLAGLACAWLGLAMAAPAAFAVTHPSPGPAGYLTPGAPGFPVPPPGPPPAVQVHTVVVGGMPGWQIALIAIGRRCSPPSPRCWPTGHGPPAAGRPRWPREPSQRPAEPVQAARMQVLTRGSPPFPGRKILTASIH